MTASVIQITYILVSLYSGLVLVFFALWNQLGWKKRHMAVLAVCYALYISAAYSLANLHWEMDMRSMQIFMPVAVLPTVGFKLWLFRKRLWQAIFLHTTYILFSTLNAGIGLYASETWFVSTQYPLLGGSAVTLAIGLLSLPPLLILLRRLCENPGMEQGAIWKSIWLLPLLFFGMILLSGRSFVLAEVALSGFILVRALSFLFMLLVFYILDSASRQAVEIARLNETARYTETLLDMQRGQYEQQLADAETIKRMHHDMRHHLAVMRAYKDARLGAYMDGISGAIPDKPGKKAYCENFAVNAVALHYLGAAEREGVTVDARLVLPEDTGSVPAVDVCVIMGNLLENALNACRRVKQGEKFIRASSRVEGASLSIVVENSFDGYWREKNGVYLSAGQGERQGVGLASVKAVCEKHGGILRVEVIGELWRVSALVEMDG